jgi:NAD(P)H-nitrite reductase large subunit
MVVEEILARGGGEMFEIAMFGDEPFGNYNRIMLSAVLEGSTDADAILLNPLQWYSEHAIRLRRCGPLPCRFRSRPVSACRPVAERLRFKKSP